MTTKKGDRWLRQVFPTTLSHKPKNEKESLNQISAWLELEFKLLLQESTIPLVFLEEVAHL